MPFGSQPVTERKGAEGGTRSVLYLRALAVGLVFLSRVRAEPLAPAGSSAAADFETVRPILEARCLSCHGPDKQESNFRLDDPAAALRGGTNGVAIVPGKSSESPMLTRITGADPDLVMPPEGERLQAEAVAAIRSWIDGGAVWPTQSKGEGRTRSDHWSLRSLERPPVPKLDSWSADGIRNPIDAFILARLEKEEIEPSPEADRTTLIRRLAIDLTGLPPTPDEAAAFQADDEPGAYERLVDRLLASPRYGERWARHWMDVVHFAETHGNDQDRPRPNAWPYRDYVIRSFNQDKPYPRFVAEQVAGDVLYPRDPWASVALGFLAAGPWDESSLMCIVDDTVDKKLAQVLDRDDMITNVMSTFTSATVQCARCHNHKFDPISQTEYYNLQAVFAGVDRAERPFDPDPSVHRRRRRLNRKAREWERTEPARLVQLARSDGLVELEQRVRAAQAAWSVWTPVAVSSTGGATHAVRDDGSILFSGSRPEKDTYTFAFEGELTGITAVRLEVLADDSLPKQGPGRQDNGNLHLSEFTLSIAPTSLPDAPGGGAQGTLEPKPESARIAMAYADFNQDGWEIGAAIDGKPETAWGVHPDVGKSHSAVFVLAEPLRTATGAGPGAGTGAANPVRLTIELAQLHGAGHLIGRPRISVTKHPEPELARPLAADLALIIGIDRAARSEAQALTLARALGRWRLDAELAQLPAPQMVYAAASEFKGGNNFRPAPLGMPRPVHVLRRGDIHQPLAEATPAALACVPGLEASFALANPMSEGERRAALARWLVDPKNVLTYRSIVNRIWHYHFDRGLCDTPGDLGKMGGAPSHPELVDWLAVEFRDSGGSLKTLHRLLVTSATYRQASRIDPGKAARDGDNRLLWRMNSRRMDAETIRDALLLISGKLDLTMGGPSVRQFVQSPGIHVTPNVDYQSYDVDAPGNYRRGIYRFLFRTLPDPFMEALDCPDGSQLAPVRPASFTALQALALLDNRFVVRQSEHAAARLTKLAPDVAEQVKLLFQWALLRQPEAEEKERWTRYAERHGLANACRMMFNTSEFVFVQ